MTETESSAANRRRADAPLRWEEAARDGAARAGRVTTRRGSFETPAFMPVATYGAVKGVLPDELRSFGAQIVLSNTYHLHVRPGEETVAQLGGLHRFCGWSGPILTDSGGYQVFSLADSRTIDDDGVTFRDHVGGDLRRLTPESAVHIQERLGSDIMMVLDDCTGAPEDRDAAAGAMRRSASWLARSAAARRDESAALFGIVQGGVFDDLRCESVERTVDVPLDGYAVGGVSVGEGRDEIRRIVALTGPRLPDDKPRYLMGMGRPEDIVAAVAAGFDMFDCVMPTRHGRNAQLFTSEGVLNLRNARYKEDPAPLDEACECPVCRSFSRGYLRHLYATGEMLGARAGTIHNLWHYMRLMESIRDAIARGEFADLVARHLGEDAAEEGR